LDTLWDTFNTAHPAGYLRPSMSVSDIVAIRKDGVLSCHYVDRLAFTELHGFLQPENYLKSAEMAMEDDYNMVDGIINNGPKQPTVAELKEQAKSGQPISLMDLAGAIQREKEEKQQKPAPGKKPSILAKIRKPLPARGDKKTAPERSAERTEQHEKQPDLHAERGLPDPRPETERNAGGEPGQVRQDAEEVPSGEQAGALQPPAAVYDSASAPAGDRPDGAPALGADAPGAGTGGWRDGELESQRSDEVGGLDEHLQGPGGGDHSQRAGVQLTSEPEAADGEPAETAPEVQLNLFGEPMEGEQVSLFPSEAQQIQSITEAESAEKAPFAFSIPQEDIDQLLRFGSNTEKSRMRVAAEFMKQKSPEEIAAFLQKEYHGGYGVKGRDGDISAWYKT